MPLVMPAGGRKGRNLSRSLTVKIASHRFDMVDACGQRMAGRQRRKLFRATREEGTVADPIQGPFPEEV
jgi:hypothetical protein